MHTTIHSSGYTERLLPRCRRRNGCWPRAPASQAVFKVITVLHRRASRVCGVVNNDTVHLFQPRLRSGPAVRRQKLHINRRSAGPVGDIVVLIIRTGIVNGRDITCRFWPHGGCRCKCRRRSAPPELPSETFCGEAGAASVFLSFFPVSSVPYVLSPLQISAPSFEKAEAEKFLPFPPSAFCDFFILIYRPRCSSEPLW